MMEAWHRRLEPKRVPVPTLPPGERTCSFRESILLYSEAEAIEEAQRCIQCGRPWCVEACPIAQDCRLYLRQIGEGDFEGAVETIVKDNPLASCLGKVCYSYCEDACVVGLRGEPVAIRHLKWAALAYGGGDRTYVPGGEKRDEAVAVVGAGPAGLMAAWYLAMGGYPVTVFEVDRKLGGLVTQVIPPFRLSPGTMDEDLARLRELGIEFRTGVRIGKDLSLDDLFTQGYGAVFLGIGTQEPRALNLPGSDLPGVGLALDFLRRIGDGGRPALQGTVAVIGGGDVAMDCARAARRLGADPVVVLYRRTEEEMPASPQEREEAREEGVEFRLLLSPMAFEGEGQVESVVCQRMELGPPDGQGRRRPVPVEGEMVRIPVRHVLVAIGQMPDLEGLPGTLGLRVNEDGVIEADPETGATDREGVFAGGGASIVHAMAAGKRAAQCIDRYLRGQARSR